jgi:hypothetical protein
MVTLGQASKLTGLGKFTLTRAIKSGRLSASRNEDGSYSIDPSELSRVYPLIDATGIETGPMVRHATPDAIEIASLKAMAELLRDQLVTRQDRDHRREQASRLAIAPPYH